MLTHLCSNLRDRLYRESFDFVRSQRISCLHAGAWFACPASSSLSSSQRGRGGTLQLSAPKYRFYRLSANQRYLHYLETSERKALRPGVDDLPERSRSIRSILTLRMKTVLIVLRVDLSTVTEVVAGAQAGGRGKIGPTSPQMTNGSILSSGPRSPTMTAAPSTSTLSILLLRQDTTAAELIAPDATLFSEWLDGLNLLMPDGYISTRDTADYVQILTDIGIKIKLLDLSGERLEIPSALPVPIVPPAHVPFHYAE